MAGITASLVPAPASAQAPTATPAERAAAVVAPAMVDIDVAWEGRVRHRVTGELLDDQPITVSVRCGGFAVSSDGYLVTTGVCLDPATVAMSFYEQVAARREATGLLGPGQSQVFLDDLLLNGSLVGQAVDAPAQRTVTVRREVTPDDTLPATVVSIAGPIVGDVALLKIEKTNQPLVSLADPSDITVGREVVTVEYRASTDQGPPTARTGSIAVTEPLVAHAGPSDSLPGAPVLTLDAKVAGVLSRHQPTASTDLLAPVAAIHQELDKNKVVNQLGAVDSDYREGLDAYYDGRYTDAIENFDAVLAVIPSHKQAHDFRQLAQALREAEGGGRHANSGLFGSVTGWLDGALGPLAGAALVVVLALVLVRRRTHHVREPAPAFPGRTRIATPSYCTNCSNALPAEAASCPTCGQTP
jgi:hypothetical protein